MSTEIERDIGILRNVENVKIINYCAWHTTPTQRKKLQENLAPDEVLSSRICTNCYSKELGKLQERGVEIFAAAPDSKPKGNVA